MFASGSSTAEHKEIDFLNNFPEYILEMLQDDRFRLNTRSSKYGELHRASVNEIPLSYTRHERVE